MKSIIRIANCLATMMPRRVAFIFFVLAMLTAWGNDGVYYTSGNHLVPLQETDISVRKEVLTISLMDNGYARVDVQYEFWNPGLPSVLPWVSRPTRHTMMIIGFTQAESIPT